MKVMHLLNCLTGVLVQTSGEPLAKGFLSGVTLLK